MAKADDRQRDNNNGHSSNPLADQRMMIKDKKAEHEQIAEKTEKNKNDNGNYSNDGIKADLNYANDNNGDSNCNSKQKSKKNNLLIHNDSDDLQQCSSKQDVENICASTDHVDDGMDGSLMTLIKKRNSQLELKRERDVIEEEENKKKRKRNVGFLLIAIIILAVSNSLVTHVFSNNGADNMVDMHENILSVLFDNDDDVENNTISTNITNCGDDVVTRCNNNTNTININGNINATNEIDKRKRTRNVPSSKLITEPPSTQLSIQQTQTSSFQPTAISTISYIYQDNLIETNNTNLTTNIDERELSVHI